VVGLVLGVRKQMPRIGTRKLHYLLEEPLKELRVGRDKLFSILNANHLSIKPKRSYRTTTNSHHRFRKHKNLIAQMLLTRPEQVWVSDITYIGNRNKHSYLSLVTDAYSKKVVGYDLSNNLGVDGALRALKMAVKQRIYKDEPLIHHSDRGIQYCSDQYQKLLGKKKIVCSMTESYDPYANAVAERVNGILKDEFQLDQYNIDMATMKKLVKDSVEIYNAKRPHYSCYMLTPEEMHHQKLVKIRTYKKTDGFKVSLETIY
jgi:transposase InsO family protein